MDMDRIECFIDSFYLKRRDEDSRIAEPTTNEAKMSLDNLAFLQQHFWRNRNPGRCQAVEHVLVVGPGLLAEGPRREEEAGIHVDGQLGQSAATLYKEKTVLVFHGQNLESLLGILIIQRLHDGIGCGIVLDLSNTCLTEHSLVL